MDIMDILPLLLQKNQQEEVTGQSAAYNALAELVPEGVKSFKPTGVPAARPALPPTNTIQPVPQQKPAAQRPTAQRPAVQKPVQQTAVQPPAQAQPAQVPVVDASKATIVNQALEDKANQANTPKGGLEAFLSLVKDPDVARGLLLAGGSQLSGESLSQSMARGFGAYDAGKASKAAAKERQFERALKKREAARDDLLAKGSYKKDVTQAELYSEQADTQTSVRNKNNADAYKSKADAIKAIATAKKVGVETEQLNDLNIPVMEALASSMGYDDEETEQGAYLEDPAFLRRYNAQVEEDSRIYNKFDVSERTKFRDEIMNEEGSLYDVPVSIILSSLDIDGIYRPAEAKRLRAFVKGMASRRDAAREKALKTRTSLRDTDGYSRNDPGLDMEF